MTLRLSLLALGTIGFILLALKIATWKAEADRASVLQEKVESLELSIQQERKLVREADQKRLEVGKTLRETQSLIQEVLTLKQKVIVRYVEDRRECDLNDAAVRVLREARDGGPSSLPPAAGSLVGASQTSGRWVSPDSAVVTARVVDSLP